MEWIQSLDMETISLLIAAAIPAITSAGGIVCLVYKIFSKFKDLREEFRSDRAYEDLKGTVSELLETNREAMAECKRLREEVARLTDKVRGIYNE